jgi:hypothetical protein
MIEDREMEEHEFVHCASTDRVQADCATGCPHICWKDPDRVLVVQLPAEGR